MRLPRAVRALVLCVVGSILSWGGIPSLAVEPAGPFLEGLRQRGYYDLVGEYLNRMATSKLVSPDFQATIPYEQGLTLVQQSRLEPNAQAREKKIDEATAKFRSFLAKHKDHPLASQARSQLGNVIVERARLKVAEAGKPANAAGKSELLGQARTRYEEAAATFQSLLDTLKATLSKPEWKTVPKEDVEKTEQLARMRQDYIQYQLVVATILHEIADTAATKAEKDEHLKKAADAYGKIHEKYRRMLAGLYAQMNQGRCYQEIGDLEEALFNYGDLLVQPDEPDVFRMLRTRTLKLAMQCWFDPSYKKEKEKAKERQQERDEALDACSKWIAKARPVETGDTDWLELRYELARAYNIKAASLNDNDRDKQRYLTEAKGQVAFGIKNCKSAAQRDLKKKFQALMAELGGPVAQAEKPNPQTFVEARDVGREALDRILSSSAVAQLCEKKIPQTKDADRKAELEKQLEDAKERMKNARFDAMEYFRRALVLADDETSPNDLNTVRYYLCYLYYSQSDYLDAAVVGEFVAERYPQFPRAQQCGRIAMVSYYKLYKDAEEKRRQTTGADATATDLFEARQLVRVADYIATQWPDQPSADESLITLITLMVRQERLDEAEKYLARIPAESPRRGEAELKTGQALWGSYLSGIKQVRLWEQDPKNMPQGVDIAKRKAELEDVKKRAQKTLREGIDRMKKEQITSTLTSAVLSLAQIYVDADQAAEAIALLEDPTIGAKTLVEKKHEATRREGYAEETYKTALRAYITGLPDAADPAAFIKKAQGAMDALATLFGDSKEDQAKLIDSYISLAQELKQQMDVAEADRKRALAQGFETFLDRVGAGAGDFTVRNWVAESFLNLGRGFDTGQGEPVGEAARYYGKAARMYEKIKEQTAKDKTIGESMKLQIRMRLAIVQGQRGEYEKAIEELKTVLEAKKLLNVQVDAAMMYQRWGQTPGNAKKYLKAVGGDFFNPARQENTIWGWGKIAQIAAKQMNRGPQYQAKYAPTFHQARHHLALCYYRYALEQGQGTGEQKKYLQKAAKAIELTATVFPGPDPEHPDDPDKTDPSEVGADVETAPGAGTYWKAEYDALLKQIQASLGKKAVGLAALKKE